MTAKTTTSPINKDKNFFARTISAIKKFFKKDFQLSPKAVEIDNILENNRDIELNMPKEQIDFMHEQAEKIATEIDKSIEIINKKAETVFKYLVAIATALLWLYVYGAKTKIAIDDKYILGIIFIILIFIGIYIWAFIYPKDIGSVNSEPLEIIKTILDNRNRLDKTKYLINNIVSLQNNICISTNNLKKRARYLKIFITLTLAMCFVIVIALFFL
jgi:hypothetical protein